MRSASLLSILSVYAAVSAHAEAPRQLTVEDAVRIALVQNPRLLGGAARVRANKHQASSLGARMLPGVRLSDEWQYYDSPFKIQFGQASFQARDQSTNTFVAGADQPLLGLLHLSQDYLALRDDAEAGEAQLKAAEAQLRAGVREGFLRYFEARALEEIARTSEGELQQQVDQAQVKIKAGVATNADLLRVQVAQGNARQQQILAHAQATVARATLLQAIGIGSEEAVELVEPKELLAQSHAAVPQFAGARDEALAHRAEIAQRRALASAAAHQRSARLFAMLPEVDAEAAYIRIDGQIFAPKDSAYVGVKAQWPIWEWGAGFFQQRAASANAEAAKQDLEEQRAQVATEVAVQLAQAEAAGNAVALAEQTIASAQEAYRVTDALVRAGSATTTDLLDSQAALTQARLNLTRAQYEMAIAHVSLNRSIGK